MTGTDAIQPTVAERGKPMTAQVTETEITFHRDDAGAGHAAVNIKRYEWPNDLGDDLDELDQQNIFEIVQKDWHDLAAGVAHAHGYSDCFTEGRSAGWLLPFRQVNVTGQLQYFGCGSPPSTGQGGDKGFPEYPNMKRRVERRIFVAFRSDIEALLEEVPDMARAAAANYRANKEASSVEAASREVAITEASVRQAQRQQVVKALKGTGFETNATRFDLLAEKTCADWHEPDEQGIEALVFGQKLDNAFGTYIDPEEPERLGEIVVVLTKDGVPHCSLNLATLLAEASAYRRAVKFNGLHPADVRGPTV